MKGKDWKAKRKPQAVVVPKLGPPPNVVPNSVKPIELRQARFCDMGGVLGLAIGIQAETQPIYRRVDKIDVKTGLVTCGKDIYKLTPGNLRTPEEIASKLQYFRELEASVGTLTESLSQAKTELRETQKENLQLRGLAKKGKKQQKENMF